MELLLILVGILFVAFYLFRPTSKKELEKFKDKDNWSNMGF
tara:strand:- start:448 stop:570 length:123 start_codon:yes stop_codon:yes gene_type:complete